MSGFLPRSMQPSPLHRRVGIRIATFEACSGFTHVTARRLAQPPKATFVTGLQPTDYADKLPVSYSTKPATIEVEPSSTGNTPLRGTLCKIALARRYDLTRGSGAILRTLSGSQGAYRVRKIAPTASPGASAQYAILHTLRVKRQPRG